MLSVAKVLWDEGAEFAEYLFGRTVPSELGEGYLKDGMRVEVPGRWVGSGVVAVGAEERDAVDDWQLYALLSAQNPASELPLHDAPDDVVATDATFCAPTSVSAVWALGSPELRLQIEQAQENAVDRVLSYALQQVPMLAEPAEPDACACALVATSWRHTTSLAKGDRLPHPFLHSHVLLHAALDSDGEIDAIDPQTIHEHRRELGAAYRTQLAHHLHQLGFGIQRGTGQGGRYFEIEGVPAALIEQWSSHTQDVQAELDAREC